MQSPPGCRHLGDLPIGPYVVPVVEDATLPENLDGEWTGVSRLPRIRLSPGMPLQRCRVVLYHEIVHAAVSLISGVMANEEACCDIVGMIFAQCLDAADGVLRAYSGQPPPPDNPA